MRQPKIHLLAILFLGLLPACSGSKASLPDRDFKFPPGFLWGSATAAYQVEGGIRNDWSVAGLDAGEACRHYEKYPQDFQLARKMGLNAHRFSIEWSRIEPAPGQWNMAEVEHYRQVLRTLKKEGQVPFVTLHHFTNPIWLAQQGGWADPAVVEAFTRYVRFIVSQLKDEVEFWITINEPEVYAFKAFDAGVWPPYVKNRQTALQVIKHLIQAHGKAYRAIHAADPAARVGFVKHATILEANFKLNPLDHLVAYFQHRIFNHGFWQAMLHGQVELSIPGVQTVKVPFDPDLKGSMDFIGLNYYTRWMVSASGEQLTRKGAPRTDLDWEIYPQGLLSTLEMANEYASALKIPIYITENGLADKTDQHRPAFIVAHLAVLWQAIQQGIPVKGYLHWSLIDNFEWAERYEPKFGLVDVERRWRPSASVYQAIAMANAIPPALVRQYLPQGLP